ncbi:NAD(P)-binding protein [Rhizodiscina lignyota]|uniref:NAD(P)-binding protein n=1 Tax=Rhizodiscina lignyota TaxID=1504668 RepID=A0A9P4M1K1_9PEZI|nr:NAD(P)-binding protein [Rhizodiscina lignyota]
MSVLLVGASGQVGGAFLTVFRQAYPSVPLTLFLRTHALDNGIASLGNTTVVHGDFENDLSVLEKLASEHSIVIDAAASRFLDVNEAILRGVEAYKEKNGRNAIYIHLSGAGNFIDRAKDGVFKETNKALDLPFIDTNPEQVKKIDASMPPNGAADEVIIRAAEDGKVNAYILCPVGIYGASENHIGLLAGAEGAPFAKTLGVWVGWMVGNIVDKGYSPYIGPGTSEFVSIHVDDVVDAMMKVYARATQDSEQQKYGKGSVLNEFYLLADKRWPNKQIAELFAEAVVRLGKLKGDGERVEARSVTFEEAGTTAGYLGGNTLIEPKNAKKLGWKPRGPGLAETLKTMKA